MRKVIAFMLTSLDGYFEGPNADISWHNVDEEFNDFAIKQLNSADSLLFGRVTYQMMASYWPTNNAKQDDPIVSRLMNETPKFVFSKTLTEVSWENTTLISSDSAEQLQKLKNQDGKDLFIFGSSDFTASMINAGLVDELRIMVNPILLGNGRVLFDGIDSKIKLKLSESRVFGNGNVLLSYMRAK